MNYLGYYIFGNLDLVHSRGLDSIFFVYAFISDYGFGIVVIHDLSMIQGYTTDARQK